MKRVPAKALLFLVVLGAYLVNGRTIGAGDTLPARYLPWSILQHRSMTLDPFPSLYDEAAVRAFPVLDGIPYYLLRRSGHYVSAYTPGPGVLALPVYALPILLGARPDTAWAAGLEKLSAALITALSAVLLFAALRRLVSDGWALGIALVYALGTSSLSISSQGLWQHGPSQLFLTLLIYCLVRGLGEERFLAYAGFAISAAVAMRSTNLVLVLPVALWIVFTRSALIPRLVLWALLPAAGMLLYNVVLFRPLAFAAGHTTAPLWALFSQIPLHEGLAGILVSPGRGLFVYSPVLLFSIIGAITVWRRGPWAFRALSLGLPLIAVVVGKWFLWWGGHSWGPRLLADTTPILCFFLYPLTGLLSRRPVLKVAFIALAVLSVAAHGLGAALYDGRWDSMGDLDRNNARLWSWTRSPLAFYGGEALAGVRRVVSPVTSGRPTSADAPDQLAVVYDTGSIPAQITAGESMPLSVRVTNTGRAVWLASAPGERGAARLGWRWLCCGAEAPGGRAGLSYDVLPGQAERLTARVSAPADPGEYTLVVDMVSELVTWFSARGSKRIEATIRVVPLDVNQLLSAPMASVDPKPVATVATDRTAYRQRDPLELMVTLTYPHRPLRYDAYLILRGPEASAQASALIFDGQRLSAAAEKPWRAWIKGLPLTAKATARFSLPLVPLAPGAYQWHVVLTEPGTYRAVARAAAPFTLEP
jgi:hypothetical protein